jgi:hypothetical protein
MRRDIPMDCLPDPKPLPGGKWQARVTGRYHDGTLFEQYDLGGASGQIPLYDDFETALAASTRLLKLTVPRIRF